jgi:hypothetical protein
MVLKNITVLKDIYKLQIHNKHNLSINLSHNTNNLHHLDLVVFMMMINTIYIIIKKVLKIMVKRNKKI